MNYTTRTTRPASVLAQLRDLVPERPLSLYEARRITELQAHRLRQLVGVTDPELPDEAITDLPRVRVIEVADLPSSGVSQWSGGKWIIALSGSEPWQRQRFTTGHELWHIINYRTTAWLCPPDRFNTASGKAERLADYFSGCLHMPKGALKRLVGEGLDAEALADTFGVSVPAVMVRLSQLGFNDSRNRCARTTTRSRGVAA